MNTKNTLIQVFLMIIILSSACDNDIVPDENQTEKGIITFNLGDSRGIQTKLGMTQLPINSDKLTKYEITIANIYLIPNQGDEIALLNESKNVDLRQFRTDVANLINTELPYGTYSGFKIEMSGVSITYDGNNYTANYPGTATATLACANNITVGESEGVPNTLTSTKIFQFDANFTIDETIATKSIRINFDAEASCYELAYTIPIINTICTFAVMRPEPYINMIFEEGIQQIRHSPPLDIQASLNNEIDYEGIHTFIDFNEAGGTITAHTSQHVFRGENADLKIDAESEEINSTTLSTTTIASSGETNITANEIFKCSELQTQLASKGYELESGKIYYFSLLKTWTIETGGSTYNLTRMCEPIPVYWP